MELNWSTVVLEMINFLVLVWILKRFLYKPVLQMIARRQAGIEQNLADAKALHVDAEKLREQYEGRLANWNEERQKARESLSQEMNAERAAKLNELESSLQQEREKARVAEARHRAEELHKMEETALKQGARFASRVLEQVSGPETQARLVELVAAGLTQLPAERIAAVRDSFWKTSEPMIVVSAFPLAEDQRQRLGQALATVAGRDPPLQFELDNKLLAGVRISIGGWVFSANLFDELRGFMELPLAEKQS